MVLVTPNSSILEQALKLEFKASNNEAENEALVTELRVVAKLQSERVINPLRLDAHSQPSHGRLRRTLPYNGALPEQRQNVALEIWKILYPTNSKGRK